MFNRRERSRSKSPNNSYDYDAHSLSDSLSVSVFGPSPNNASKKKSKNNVNNNNIINNDQNMMNSEVESSVQPKRKRYTLLEKKQLVEKYKSIKLSDPNRGIRSIASELNVPRSCLQDWCNKYKCFKDKVDLENKYRLEGAGRTPESVTVDDVLVKWVSLMRRLGIALSTNEIIIKLMELDKKQINKGFRVLQIWSLTFLRKFAFCIRRSSAVGQKLRENNREAYNKFFETLFSLRKNLGESKGYGNIFNMDEIPIYFNLVSKNEVVQIGERYVNTIKQYAEGIKISVMLCVSASGDKLPPLVLFRGKNNEYTENLLRKLTMNKSHEIYAICCEENWADRQGYIFWLKNVFFPYKLNDEKYQKILVTDRGVMEYEDDFINWFNKNNSKYVLIPPGLTKVIQPLDMSISEKFRRRMLYWDIDFKLNNQYIRRQTEEEIIDEVIELWYDDNFITREEIIKGFKNTGIGSEIQDFKEKYDYEISDNILDSNDGEGEYLDNMINDVDNKIYIY
jgi:transposase-like protein